jgi:hypothetical protein
VLGARRKLHRDLAHEPRDRRNDRRDLAHLGSTAPDLLPPIAHAVIPLCDGAPARAR